MKNKRHKWDAKTGSSSVGCVKCGCIRQFVGGIPTYFIDDNVYDRKAPECDERLLKNIDLGERR